MTSEVSKLKPRSADKREEVLDIASENFLSKGFDGTSINVMAREAGISKESIYRYFGSKEDLFMAVVERELSYYGNGMLETTVNYQDETFREALLKVAEATLRLVSTDRTLALRRLVFQMSANGSKVGSHYYAAGPDTGYRNLMQLFDYYKPKSKFSHDKLSKFFPALVLHRATLQRECGVLDNQPDAEIRQHCLEAIEDFLQAFCPEEAGK
ncbi:MAG TPA: TetR/AcrR family transcriptional regulator [Candidatus Acidoferrum sp.]|nr:TetR/AcrR family transcriptional regulator [Candidatus Acidoferrum sp.]